MWYLCYHSIKYPVTSFAHIDGPECSDACNRTVVVDSPHFQQESNNITVDHNENSLSQCIPNPLANFFRRKSSKNLCVSVQSQCFSNHCSQKTESHDSECSRCHVQSPVSSLPRRVSTPIQVNENIRAQCSSSVSNSVGHVSHIPRTPPTPATYTVPSIVNINKSMATEPMQNCNIHNGEDLFGMIKLKENDVCYTSGTIEWVGRKRSFPINSGFKILECRNDPCIKKVRKLNRKFSSGVERLNESECSCPDVLPTVNAIVDHLNALHEAVDIIDLRLTTVEEDVCEQL